MSIPPATETAALSPAELQQLADHLAAIVRPGAMTLPMLEGYLAAIAIGPNRVLPGLWLPRIWGRGDPAQAAAVADSEDGRQTVGLVTRLHNNTIDRLLGDDDHQPPIRTVQDWPGAIAWAEGFRRGMEFSRAEWAMLLDARVDWFRPMMLAADSGDGAANPEGRLAEWLDAAALALVKIHAFWLEMRRPREQAPAPKPVPQRAVEKAGRNDPCPCGSGKKYKKCCGA